MKVSDLFEAKMPADRLYKERATAAIKRLDALVTRNEDKEVRKELQRFERECATAAENKDVEKLRDIEYKVQLLTKQFKASLKESLNEDWGSSDWYPVMRAMERYMMDGYSMEEAAKMCADRWYEDMGWDEPEQAEMNIIARFKRLQQNPPKHEPKPTDKPVREDLSKTAYMHGWKHGVEGSGNNMDKAKREWGDEFESYNKGFLAGRNKRSKLDKTFEKTLRKKNANEGLMKDLKRLGTGKDLKSRTADEIKKSQEASMTGDHKTSKKHFDRYSKLASLTAIKKVAEDIEADLDAKDDARNQLDEGMFVVKNKDGKEKRFKSADSAEAKAWKETSATRNPIAKLAVHSDAYWQKKENDSDDRDFVTPWKSIKHDQAAIDKINAVVENQFRTDKIDWTLGRESEIKRDGTTCAAIVVRVMYEFGPEDDMGLDEPVQDAQNILVARNPKKPTQIDFVQFV